MSRTDNPNLTVVYRGHEKPLAEVGAWELYHFGLSESGGVSPLNGGSINSLEYLATTVDQGLSRIKLPSDIKFHDNLDLTISYLTRGPVASIFRVDSGEENGTSLIATVARNTELNKHIESEYAELEKFHTIVANNPFFTSLPSSSFHTPRPLGIAKNTDGTPSVYYCEQVNAYTAYLETNDNREHGFTSFALHNSLNQEKDKLSDDCSIGASAGLNSEELRAARHKGKQVLEDLAYYLLGAAMLTKTAIVPNLSWGGLMIEHVGKPKLYLTSFYSHPEDSQLQAVSKQFASLTTATVDDVLVYPRNVLMRSLEKFLKSELYTSSELCNSDLRSAMLPFLNDSWQKFLTTQERRN